MLARSAASTPPVSAKTVCTAYPRSCSHGIQKLVSSPPENAKSVALASSGAGIGDGERGNGGSVDIRVFFSLKPKDRNLGQAALNHSLFPIPDSRLRDQRSHQRLLHMQAILGFVDGDA